MDFKVIIVFIVILSIFITWLIFFVSDLYGRFKAIRNIVNTKINGNDIDHNQIAKIKLEAIKEITDGFNW